MTLLLTNCSVASDQMNKRSAQSVLAEKSCWKRLKLTECFMFSLTCQPAKHRKKKQWTDEGLSILDTAAVIIVAFVTTAHLSFFTKCFSFRVRTCFFSQCVAGTSVWSAWISGRFHGDQFIEWWPEKVTCSILSQINFFFFFPPPRSDAHRAAWPGPEIQG